MREFAFSLIVVISIACAIASLFLWKFANSKEKIFIYYIFAIGFFELLSRFLLAILNGNNLPGLHLYTLVQFVLMTLFFNACLKELSSWFKYKWILTGGVIGIIVNSMFFQPIFTFNSYSKSLVEIYIIIMSIVLFVLFIKDKSHDQLNMKASLSFVSAVFMNSSVSFIIFMYSHEIIEMKKSLSYIIHNVRLAINYISLFLIIYGMVQIYCRNKMLRMIK